MITETKNLIHGRETYIADFGSDFVMKRPLPTFGPDACQTWLTKQHRTKQAIDEIYESFSSPAKASVGICSLIKNSLNSGPLPSAFEGSNRPDRQM